MDNCSDASFYRKAVPTTNAEPTHVSADEAQLLLTNYINDLAPPVTVPDNVPIDAPPFDAPNVTIESDTIHTPTPAEPHVPLLAPDIPISTPDLIPDDSLPNFTPSEPSHSGHIGSLLDKLRAAPHIEPFSNSQFTSSSNSFEKLLKNERGIKEPAEPVRIETNQQETDARQRWLSELRKLQEEFNMKLSKDRWTMSDTSASMQYECRKSYQRLINRKRKSVAVDRIIMFGQVVKYANFLFKLNLPTLATFDKKMEKMTEDPVTLYKLDEMYNESADLDPEDPKFYLAKQLLWPILTAALLKVAIIIFKPYVNVEELLHLVDIGNDNPGHESGPHKSATTATGSLLSNLISNITAATGSVRNNTHNSNTNRSATKQKSTNKKYDLNALLQGN